MFKEAAPQPREVVVTPPPPPASQRVFVLVPEGLSFRLFAFGDVDSARVYAGSRAPALRHEGVVAFRGLDSRPPPGRGGQPEAVVMVRDDERPGIVQLYSFVDMAAAQSFLRDSVAEGLGLGTVAVYWAALLSLDSATPAPIAPAASRAVRVSATRPAAPSGHERMPAAAPARVGAAPRAGYPWKARSRRLIERMVAAATLREAAYADLSRDPEASGNALLAVTLGALAAGLGSARGGLSSALWHVPAGVVGWAVFAAAVYFIGASMLGGRRAHPVRFLQAVGLAYSPAVLLVLALLPVYGPLLVLGVSIWVCAAAVIALTTVLELDRQTAALAAGIGWFPLFAISQVVPALLVS